MGRLRLYSDEERAQRKSESQKKYNIKPHARKLALTREVRYLYQVSDLEYHTLLKNAKGVCCICKKVSLKTLHLDHDHTTGKIRGVICGLCNRGLGMFHDNIMILNNAIKYLKGTL